MQSAKHDASYDKVIKYELTEHIAYLQLQSNILLVNVNLNNHFWISNISTGKIGTNSTLTLPFYIIIMYTSPALGKSGGGSSVTISYLTENWVWLTLYYITVNKLRDACKMFTAKILLLRKALNYFLVKLSNFMSTRLYLIN